MWSCQSPPTITLSTVYQVICRIPATSPLNTLTQKLGVSNHLVDFYEDFSENAEDIKQRHVDILSEYKLDIAHLAT